MLPPKPKEGPLASFGKRLFQNFECLNPYSEHRRSVGSCVGELRPRASPYSQENVQCTFVLPPAIQDLHASYT